MGYQIISIKFSLIFLIKHAIMHTSNSIWKGATRMSRKKRANQQAKKANSPAAKAKRAKKAYYASEEAKKKWADKQKRKHEKLEEGGLD